MLYKPGHYEILYHGPKETLEQIEREAARLPRPADEVLETAEDDDSADEEDCELTEDQQKIFEQIQTLRGIFNTKRPELMLGHLAANGCSTENGTDADDITAAIQYAIKEGLLRE